MTKLKELALWCAGCVGPDVKAWDDLTDVERSAAFCEAREILLIMREPSDKMIEAMDRYYARSRSCFVLAKLFHAAIDAAGEE